MFSIVVPHSSRGFQTASTRMPIRTSSAGMSALAQEAELMLMDEPLTGLDAPAQEGLLNLLDTLRNQNVTVMVATHDLEQAARHFDRIMLLNHRIVAFDVPQQVLRTDNLLQAYGGRLKLDPQGT